MAVPSAVPIGALVFVLAAGAGLAGVTADAVLHGGLPHHPAHTPAKKSPVSSRPTVTRSSPVKLPRRNTSRAHLDAAPHVLVEVYNNSGVSGLAAQKASLLESAGWNVAATDNWYGDIPSNTVYYPSQLHADARKLAKVLGVVRLRPAVAPMQFDRLTVIFTAP